MKRGPSRSPASRAPDRRCGRCGIAEFSRAIRLQRAFEFRKVSFICQCTDRSKLAAAERPIRRDALEPPAQTVFRLRASQHGVKLQLHGIDAGSEVRPPVGMPAYEANRSTRLRSRLRDHFIDARAVR